MAAETTFSSSLIEAIWQRIPTLEWINSTKEKTR